MTFTDPLIRDKDGAAMIGASVATFRRRVADGTIAPPIKIGGMSRWRRSDIEAVIARAEARRETNAA
ncbi:helix-turn-helix transcriptional regulator [Rubellimicrobium roseum]|uniref:DNA-binding protein n=1 Tax=Rubellimicrobium roseum TaxID=687525 RepID=A0A5C4NJM6_9RHOB|nr:DNA-binding protein [Rubellimicrobium roseum]TNC74160.1 DNA-binding protein [Rubellimicrobium roseum]